MYVPAALSIASDFWRFSLIGAIAGHLGEVEVGVFTSSYRILWICLTLSGAIAASAGIKIGMALVKKKEEEEEEKKRTRREKRERERERARNQKKVDWS